YHFSFCLVCLVISMLTSIVLTRLSVDDISLKCGSTAKVHPSEEDHHTVDSEKALTDFQDSRSLAESIIAKKLKSAPQGNDCSVHINITSMQYELLAFRWKDPKLQSNDWPKNISAIMLPYDKIWTPGLVLDNAIDVSVKQYTSDVAVMKDGTVEHAVILFITVSCNINLFTYPFVSGDCRVAINGWNQSGCALMVEYPDNITISGNSQSGEWNSDKVSIRQDEDFKSRRYVLVALSINPFSAVVTLILPSVLIMLADLVSFALPVQGGERNNLKVTLVLSFTMFLLILNEHLSSGGECSPLLHYHFCFCLINLVLSMVMSIVLTRLALADSIQLCKCSVSTKTENASEDQEEATGAPTTTMSTDLTSKLTLLQKIVNILEGMQQKDQETTKNESFVDRLDKFCFLLFVFIDIVYIIIVAALTKTEICKPKKIVIWSTDYFYGLLNYSSYNDTYLCSLGEIPSNSLLLPSSVPERDEELADPAALCSARMSNSSSTRQPSVRELRSDSLHSWPVSAVSECGSLVVVELRLERTFDARTGKRVADIQLFAP
ncbi:hypothetical protein DNTS_029247, partial [Danionella cerebrum]